MKIVLPYVGSKQRFFNLIKDNIPQDHLYIEPFTGGFSLGLTLLDKGLVQTALINDTDTNVYNFWRLIKEDYWSLVEAIDTLITHHNKIIGVKSLEEVNEELNALVQDITTQTALFYLHKKMNMGTSRQKVKADLSFGKMDYTETFQQASQLLQTVTVHNKSYEALKPYDGKKVLWYLDPPYVKANNSAYYAQCKETEFNHKLLRDFVLSIQGKVILSYDDCPLIHELYKDLYMHPIHVPSSLNSKGYSEEVLISNFPIVLGEKWKPRKPRTKHEHTDDTPTPSFTGSDLFVDI